MHMNMTNSTTFLPMIIIELLCNGYNNPGITVTLIKLTEIHM